MVTKPTYDQLAAQNARMHKFLLSAEHLATCAHSVGSISECDCGLNELVGESPAASLEAHDAEVANKAGREALDLLFAKVEQQRSICTKLHESHIAACWRAVTQWLEAERAHAEGKE